MTISSASAARTLCELRNWTLSNLEIQKILYLAHMFYMGRTGEPLVNETFQAWDYGPVLPTVYARVRGYGSAPVENVFFRVPPVAPETQEYAAIREAAEGTRGLRAGRLVALTHTEGGAWARNYQEGVRGIEIPNADIIAEYRQLEGRAD